MKLNIQAEAPVLFDHKYGCFFVFSSGWRDEMSCHPFAQIPAEQSVDIGDSNSAAGVVLLVDKEVTQNEKSNRNTHTRRSAVRLCADSGTYRRDHDDHFNLRNNNGERNNPDGHKQGNEPSSKHYSECDRANSNDYYHGSVNNHNSARYDQHSQPVGDGDRESHNHSGNNDRACVGAAGACQRDHDNESNNADRACDNEGYNHNQSDNQIKADGNTHNYRQACGDHDYEDHSTQAPNHIKNNHHRDHKRDHLCRGAGHHLPRNDD